VVVVVGRSEARLVVSLPDDFLISVHLEVGHELRLGLLDQLFLVLLSFLLIVSRQGFLSRLNDVARRDVRAIY
jgi:hypothetical protein